MPSTGHCQNGPHERDRVPRSHVEAWPAVTCWPASAWRFRPASSSACLGPNGSGQDDADARHPRPGAGEQGEIRVLGRPAARGNPAVGYMPQVRSAGGQLRLSGWDFVAGVVNGHRLGLPFLGKAARAEVDRVLDLVDASAIWLDARWPRSPAESGSACCWPRH